MKTVIVIFTKMLPKYALVDFFESKTVDVCCTTDIVWGTDGVPVDFNSIVTNKAVVTIKWCEKKGGGRGKSKKTRRQEYSAKLLKFHGICYRYNNNNNI